MIPEKSYKDGAMLINRGDNIFSITLIISVIFLLLTVISLYMAKEGERGKRVSLQKEIEGIIIEKQELDSKLKQAEAARSEAVLNIKLQEEKIGALSRDLEEEKAANTANVSKIQEKEFEINSLKTKIEDAKLEKQAAVVDMEKLNERFLGMKFQLENLLKTKEDLEKKAKEMIEREGVSLGTVVIKQSRN